MDNLHFIPNNILTKFFKDLTKYKKHNYMITQENLTGKKPEDDLT